jgi:cystathionine beta-lyase
LDRREDCSQGNLGPEGDGAKIRLTRLGGSPLVRLFSIFFRDRTVEAVDGFIDRLRLYGIGASWGGYESLATHPEVAAIRTKSPWDPRERLVRLHIGLEDPGDLIADLEQALAAMA